MIPWAWLHELFDISLNLQQPAILWMTTRAAACSPDWQTKGSFSEQEVVFHLPSALMPPQLEVMVSEGSQLVKWARLDQSPPRDHAQDVLVFLSPIQHTLPRVLPRVVSRDRSWVSWTVARSVYFCLQYFWALPQVLDVGIRKYSRWEWEHQATPGAETAGGLS